MNKTFLLFAFAVLFIAGNQPLKAQEAVANKLFYTELFGPGVLMSANFDGRFNSNERLGLGYRIGAGFGVSAERNFFWNNDRKRQSYYTIPVGLNYVLGKPNSSSSFEVGAGATFLTKKVSPWYTSGSYYNTSEDEKPGHVIGFFTFMYRKIPVDGGFSFRVGFTPIIGTSGDLIPMGAVGFGWAF